MRGTNEFEEEGLCRMILERIRNACSCVRFSWVMLVHIDFCFKHR